MNVAKAKLSLLIMALCCSFLMLLVAPGKPTQAESGTSIYLSQDISKIDEEIIDESDNPFTNDMIDLYILAFSMGIIGIIGITIIERRKKETK